MISKHQSSIILYKKYLFYAILMKICLNWVFIGESDEYNENHIKLL